jgi:hypothetical protein
VNGALKVWVPPHPETVKVPVAGAELKVIAPETLYKLFEQAVGVADNEVIEQLQDAGAV